MDDTIINNLIPKIITSHLFLKLGFVFLDNNEHSAY